MSPRRTRAATAEQSVVSTRSKAQKIDNVSEDVTKQTKQSQRREKSLDVKNNLEATVKQSTKKASSDAKEMFRKSVQKKVSRRRLNLAEGAIVDDKSIVQEDQNTDSNESIRVLRDRRNDNVPTIELVKNNLPQLNTSSLNSDKTSNEKLQRQLGITIGKISPVIVTPKSTPPKLSLTPHRSKKTPKKSPISLGSPKTHSVAVPRLFKSPRKLSLATTSEENLNKSDNNSRNKKSPKIKKDSLGNISNKSLLTSSIVKDKHKKSNKLNLNAIVRRFSKSPKIVLRSPKSKKSKSRKLKLLSPPKIRKSTLETSTTSNTTPDLDTTKSSRISTRESPLYKGKDSAIKRRLLDSKLKKVLTTSQMKDVLAEPVVLLEKLSPESYKVQNMQKASNKTQSNTLIKVSPLIGGGSRSKILLPIATRISVSSDTSVDRSFSAKLKNSSMEVTTRVSPRIKHDTMQEKDGSSIPLMSSTPREEKTPLIDMNLTSSTPIVSIDNTSLSTRSRHRNQSNTQLSSTMDKSIVIGSVSKSSIFDKDVSDTNRSHFSSVRKRDVTHDRDSVTMLEKKQENKKDGTYELKRPQTLSLRQMIKKRTSTNANLSAREGDVKRAKVRFADVTTGADNAHKSINKSTRSQSNIIHNVSAQRSNIMNSAHKLKKIETPKFGGNSLVSSFKARSSPRTNEVTPKGQLSGIQVTPKTFASIEKKSEKKSSVKRKVPNFGKIHEQMFAKSESLVDAKKRLEARHLAFTANKTPKGSVKKEEKKLLPTDTRDGTHNRFGFKLRKAEATHAMLKKQAVFSRQKKQHETRMMLQGVRTNRRFELQMKARNRNI